MNQQLKQVMTKSIGVYVNILGFFSKKKAGKKAYDIFCKPRLGRLNEKQTAFLNTATSWNSLSLRGEKIQCYEWKGSGEKVLLAHGWESNSARWKNQILSLQKADFHIIALDAPAHGASESSFFNAVKYADFIHQVVTHYQPKYLVGHSVGGYASLYFLAHFPHEIQKAVVLGCPSDLTLILNKYAAMLGYSRRVKLALFEHIKQEFGKSVGYYKAADFVQQLTLQGLVINDSDDFVCAFEEGEAIAQNWKIATFLPTEKLGHGYQNRKVYHAVRDFLKEN
jgi:predicted alpha/beta hydrolase family esterase